MTNHSQEVAELFGDSPLNPESSKLLHNQYKILEKLGQGGMGAVYKAKDCINNRMVAIKRISISAGNTNNMERFRREYFFLRKLHHPNVVQAYDFFEELKTLFLVMEFAEGISLNRLIRDHPRSLDLAQQLDIGKQICQAVSVLNESQILHRDIKPQNIIVSHNRKHIKLVDFGVSKSLDESESSLTEHGYVLGTPSYLSPEQVRGMISEKSDIFSLGLTLYQFFLWLPHSPFHAEHKMVIMRNILNDTLPPLIRRITGEVSKVEHTVYQNVSEILQQALAKNPQRRLAYARELGDELGLLLELCRGEKTPEEDISSSPKIAEVLKSMFDYDEDKYTSEKFQRSDSNKKVVKDYVIYHKVWALGDFEVRVARDIPVQRDVLVKMVPPQICFQLNLQEVLLREYYMLADLEHPNILRTLDLVADKENVYSIFEGFRGLSLKQTIQEFSDSLSLPYQVKIIWQIAKAIAYLHEKGLVLSNLSPDIIFISHTDSRALLGDLTQCHMIGQACPCHVNTFSGYTSPEQIQGNVFRGSDVFSLGVVLYQFLTWQQNSPFAAMDVSIFSEKIAQEMLSQLRASISKEEFSFYEGSYHKLQVLIDAATQKDYRQRLSMSSFVSDLASIMEDLGQVCSEPAEKEQSNHTSDSLGLLKLLGEENTPIKEMPGTTNEISESSEIVSSSQEEIPEIPGALDEIQGALDFVDADNSVENESDNPINLIEEEHVSELGDKATTRLVWNDDLFRLQGWQIVFFCLKTILVASVFFWICLLSITEQSLGILQNIIHVWWPTTFWVVRYTIILVFLICLSGWIFWKERSLIWFIAGCLEPTNLVVMLLFLRTYRFPSAFKEAKESSELWQSSITWFKFILVCTGIAILWKQDIFFHPAPYQNIIIYFGLLLIILYPIFIGFITFFASMTTPLLCASFSLLQLIPLCCLRYVGWELKLRYSLQDISNCVQNPYAWVRWISFTTIAKILQYDAILQYEDSTRVRRWSRGRKTLLEYIILGVKDTHWYVRMQAVIALGKICHPEQDIMPILKECIHDPNWMVRGMATQVINTRIEQETYLA